MAWQSGHACVATAAHPDRCPSLAHARKLSKHAHAHGGTDFDLRVTAGNPEGAALLFRKAGRAARALEVAQAAGLYGVMDEIAGVVGAGGDAGLQARCVSC